MRTARALTVSPSMLCAGGMGDGWCLLLGVPAPGGPAPGGVCDGIPASGGGVTALGDLLGGAVCDGIPACTEADPPSPMNRSTHACENITLPQLRCGQ